MTTESLEERIQRLEATSRSHDVMLDMLISIGERQQVMLDNQQVMLDNQQVMLDNQQATSGRQDAMLERQQAMLERQDAVLEEVRRDARQTHRLWVRLAQRYGWLDEDGLFDEPN